MHFTKSERKAASLISPRLRCDNCILAPSRKAGGAGGNQAHDYRAGPRDKSERSRRRISVGRFEPGAEPLLDAIGRFLKPESNHWPGVDPEENCHPWTK